MKKSKRKDGIGFDGDFRWPKESQRSRWPYGVREGRNPEHEPVPPNPE